MARFYQLNGAVMFMEPTASGVCETVVAKTGFNASYAKWIGYYKWRVFFMRESKTFLFFMSACHRNYEHNAVYLKKGKTAKVRLLSIWQAFKSWYIND